MEIHPAETSGRKNDNENVIQRLTSTIHEGAQKAKSLSSACIYRVPRELRTLKESAYTPQCIAIGPLHRNDDHLQTPMQHVKTSYMNDLLCRMTQGMENQEAGQKKILQDCVAAMEKLIDDAKKCYEEEVDAEMMLVDGCFILEFLYKLYLWNNGYPQGADPIFANSFHIVTVQEDLVLLENQIPFLVLERLFPLTLARIPNKPLLLKNLSLTHYVVLPQVKYQMRPKVSTKSTVSGETSCWPRECVLWVSDKKMNNSKHQEKVLSQDSTNSGSAKTSCWPRDCISWVLGNKMNNSKPEEEVSGSLPRDQTGKGGDDANYHHILHKIHDDFLPHDRTGNGGDKPYMPSASELLYAGVKFLPVKGNNLFEVNFTEPEGPFRWFRSARFEIPFLTIFDSTEPYLRNFIALEQCSPSGSEHFTSYALLVDTLVNSDIDVQVLEKAGVIHNRLGASEDVTNLFNNLTKGVVTTDFFFADQCNRATRYSKHFWPKNMANLRRYETTRYSKHFCLSVEDHSFLFGLRIFRPYRCSTHRQY